MAISGAITVKNYLRLQKGSLNKNKMKCGALVASCVHVENKRDGSESTFVYWCKGKLLL